MKIKKIKSVKCGFDSGSGPFETITLGFTADDFDFIVGEFYFGYGMQERHAEIYENAESIIDKLVELVGNDET